MDYKKYIGDRISVSEIKREEILSEITYSANPEHGDYSVACFRFAKALKKSPQQIAEQIISSVKTDDIIASKNAVAGYANFKINRIFFVQNVLNEILEKGENYGTNQSGKGKTIVIDYSSVNIARPLHMGHLGTTAIGAALYRIYKFLSYKVVGINHLGDYGTQFGKLIYAYKKWGGKEQIEKGGVREMMRLYVKYHDQAEKNPAMDDKAREYFKMIEDGDKECVALLELFTNITLSEVDRTYKRLGVEFDSYAGERFYNDKMDRVVETLRRAKLLTESDGAQVVDLEKYGMPPCIILRSDGASLYATRDLAAAMYRYDTYNFEKCLYVVAYQQNLHFKQVFKVLELLNVPYNKGMEHVAYGMVSLETGAMSTRKGNVVFLEEVLDKAVEKALSIIKEKSPDLENKQAAAETVGVGAVVFSALYNGKIKDIVFSYDKVLNFDGETAPYVQYSCARLNSVLEKSKRGKFKITEVNDYEYALVKLLSEFENIVVSAGEKYEPSVITRYAVDIAKAVNKFYLECRVLNAEENTKNYRLAICECALSVMKKCFELLGIGVPKKM